MGGDDPWPWHEPEVMQAVLRAYTQEAWGRLEEEGSDEEGEEGPLGSQASAGSSSGSSSSGEEEGGPQGRGTAAASAGSSSDGCGSSYDSCEGGEEDGHSSRHKLTQRGKFGKVKKVRGARGWAGLPVCCTEYALVSRYGAAPGLVALFTHACHSFEANFYWCACLSAGHEVCE